MNLVLLTVVITGLVPVIHASADTASIAVGLMDGRIKSGHDDQY